MGEKSIHFALHVTFLCQKSRIKLGIVVLLVKHDPKYIACIIATESVKSANYLENFHLQGSHSLRITQTRV